MESKYLIYATFTLVCLFMYFPSVQVLAQDPIIIVSDPAIIIHMDPPTIPTFPEGEGCFSEVTESCANFITMRSCSQQYCLFEKKTTFDAQGNPTVTYRFQCQTRFENVAPFGTVSHLVSLTTGYGFLADNPSTMDCGRLKKCDCSWTQEQLNAAIAETLVAASWPKCHLEGSDAGVGPQLPNQTVDSNSSCQGTPPRGGGSTGE